MSEPPLLIIKPPTRCTFPQGAIALYLGRRVFKKEDAPRCDNLFCKECRGEAKVAKL